MRQSDRGRQTTDGRKEAACSPADIHSSSAVSRPSSDFIQRAAGIMERLRERRPRVHCITNTVAQSFTANMLLATGATPSMTIDVEEIAAFVGSADALLVNLGTLDAPRLEAIEVAVATAAEKGVPWLLDPVFIDRSPQRARHARDLIGRAPAGLRLNRAEFRILAGEDAGPENLVGYARHARIVVGLTGEVDLVTDGARIASFENGHALMGRVTAMGCAASALAAACLTVESDPFTGIAAALVAVGVAGEIAGRRAHGPGSFAAGILDAVHALDGAALRAHARIT